MTSHSSLPGRAPLLPRLKWALSSPGVLAWIVFLACLAARIVFVSLFASETPFWDQWDAEADRLLRPWMTGELTLAELFSSHNEHRIFFTRVLALAVFELNGKQWNNLVEAYVNTIPYALLMASLCFFATRGETSRLPRWGVVLILGLLAVLPFDFENAFVGFQSQFYFMALFSVGMIAFATFTKPSLAQHGGLILLGFLALFTMASGLLAAVAAGFVVALAWYTGRRATLHTVIPISGLVLVAAVGLSIITNVPGHASLKATTLHEHLSAFATVSMWPLQPLHGHAWRLDTKWLYALLLWSPWLFTMYRIVRTRVASRETCFVAAVATWVILQAIAIAHSRGHDMLTMASRYTDIAAIGVACNVWLACSALRAAPRLAPKLAVAGYGAVIVFALAARTPSDLGAARAWLASTSTQTANASAYVLTGDRRHLDQPFFHIPYPQPERLRALLDNPAIRAMLPPSIGPALTGDGRWPDTGGRRSLHIPYPYLVLRCPTHRDSPVGLILTTGDRRDLVTMLPRKVCSMDTYVVPPGTEVDLEPDGREASASWLAESAPRGATKGTQLAHELQSTIRRLAAHL